MNIPALAMRYLLVINIPLYQWEGCYYADKLWAHDLRRHLGYIAQLTLLCPMQNGRPPADMVPLDAGAGFGGLRVLGRRPANSMWQALLRSLADFRCVDRAVAASDIVHASAIGWPIPLGYYAFISSRLRRRFFIDVMESSPWRLVPGARSSVGRRLRCHAMESIARLMARNADLTLFTSAAYRNSMVPAGQHDAHVFKAVWVTREQILPRSELNARFQLRSRERPLVVGFAARLLPEKGVRVLLEALGRIEAGVAMTVKVLGTGELYDEIRQFALPADSRVTIKMLGMVEYGADFYKEVDTWDLVVVPSLSVEQPRIVFDAFARGVPVLASDTSALAECVSDGRDGWLFPTGDASAMAQRLTRLARNCSVLEACACQAIETAAAHSHERMHEERAVLIDAAWQKRLQQRVSATPAMR